MVSGVYTELNDQRSCDLEDTTHEHHAHQNTMGSHLLKLVVFLPKFSQLQTAVPEFCGQLLYTCLRLDQSDLLIL